MNTYNVMSRELTPEEIKKADEILKFTCPTCDLRGTHFMLDQETKKFFCSEACKDVYKEYKEGILIKDLEKVEVVYEIAKEELLDLEAQMDGIRLSMSILHEKLTDLKTKSHVAYDKRNRLQKLKILIKKDMEKSIDNI